MDKIRALYKFFSILIRRVVLRDKLLLSHKKWLKDNVKSNLLVDNLELTANDLVFDIGAYTGEYSANLASKYGCKIYAFEPVKEYYEIARDKLKNYNNVSLYNFGFSDKETVAIISKNMDSSSIWKKGEKEERIQLRKISDFIQSKNIKDIALIKINIEGAEYEVLNDLNASNIVKDIRVILIQFHNFVSNYEIRKSIARTQLEMNHKLDYSYELVWEKWSRRKL